MADKKEFFQDKVILITGGTGSIGSEVLRHLIAFEPQEIRIFSRSEYKQHKLRYKYAGCENLSFILGDIREFETITSASKNVDIIFHCAALKHVPVSEEMPEEFIKTNILGSINVAKAAVNNEVPSVISISTDKAVNPSNVMGLTKAIQEKVFASYSIKERNLNRRFVNVRFGNVVGTRGSLFPILYHQIVNNIPITITNAEMTRFLMSPEEAIELIFWAAINVGNGKTVIKRMKSANLKDVIKEFLKALGKQDDYPMKTIGVRVGEKIHEHLISEDELYRVNEEDGYLVITPYSSSVLKANVLSLDNLRVSLSEINKFASNYPENYMDKDELRGYIDEFIKQIKDPLDFL